MRKFNFVVLFLLVSLCAGAQAQKQLDSMKYILPHFSQGVVVLADKQFNRGVLNISPLDQAVYCISNDNDTLYVASNPKIISVSVEGRSFVKVNDSFVEIITRESETGVGIIRSVAKVSVVKTGAYGMASSTSAIKNYSVNPNSGVLTDLIIDDPRNYAYRKSACLIKNGRYFGISKKTFQKVFPDKKEYIESVWPELNLSSDDIDGVMAFYNELIKK